MIARIALFVMWLLHFLPLGVLAFIGRSLGVVLYVFGRERRNVARINLQLCFPEWSDGTREAMVRKHFQVFGRSFLEHGILWWSSTRRLQKLVRVEGIEHWHAAAANHPVILLAPHFVGLDMGGIRLNSEFPVASMYSQQKNPVFNAVLLKGRMRFGTARLASRQDGLRPILKALRQRLPFYYLPDMDFGPRDAVFAPFFGVPTATITGLSRMAKIAGAVVVPCVTRQLPNAEGYVMRFYPAWSGFPTDDIAADTRRMNAFIEERVREMPEQYYWLHKRFKTRPAGEARFY